MKKSSSHLCQFSLGLTEGVLLLLELGHGGIETLFLGLHYTIDTPIHLHGSYLQQKM